ncbi:MAG: DUF4249 family protein [Bacteroidetes Order II. Incertae sedis bacterium]|nr:DUF4249 family protein [Bacteroidetes Order II. bacterium]
MRFFDFIFRWCLTLTIAVLSGCDSAAPSETRLPLVEAYLQAEAPFPPVSVRETLFVHEAVFPDTYVPPKAQVKIHLIDKNGQIEETIFYALSSEVSGSYLPTSSLKTVLPNRQYRIEVTLLEQNKMITGETVVPDVLRLVNTNGKTFRYEQSPSYQATISPCKKEHEAKCHYIFSAESLDAQEDRVVPFWKPGNNPFNLDETPHVYSSPLFNEDNYEKDITGNIVINMLWISITHFGRTRVNLHNIDQNMVDFYRSQSQQQQQFGRFGPGEMPNAITHLAGGVGIFGSYSTLTNVIEVHP